MKLKSLKIVIGIIALVMAGLVFMITVFPMLILSLGLFSLPNPTIPEIKRGEFPFRLEYEIDGNRVVIEDVLICEYDGVGVDSGRGKFRKWKESLASGNSEVWLLEVDDNKKIYYSVGGANYYMGDMGERASYNHKFPDAAIFTREGNITSNRLVRADELLEEYNIRLISWDYTEPIENTFISK